MPLSFLTQSCSILWQSQQVVWLAWIDSEGSPLPHHTLALPPLLCDWQRWQASLKMGMHWNADIVSGILLFFYQLSFWNGFGFAFHQDLILVVFTCKKYKVKGVKNYIYTIKTARSILNAQLWLLGFCQNSLTNIVNVEALSHEGMPPFPPPRLPWILLTCQL